MPLPVWTPPVPDTRKNEQPAPAHDRKNPHHRSSGEIDTGLKYRCDNTLASEKVLYVGHAIAAVAASDPHTAEQAARLIDVEYEVLPAVTDVLDAAREDAPLLHEDMRTRSLAGTSEPHTKNQES